MTATLSMIATPVQGSSAHYTARGNIIIRKSIHPVNDDTCSFGTEPSRSWNWLQPARLDNINKILVDCILLSQHLILPGVTISTWLR